MSEQDRFTQKQTYHRTAYSPVAPGDGLDPNEAYTAVVQKEVSGGYAEVTIPAIHLSIQFKARVGKGYKPKVGEAVLLVFDNEKQPWVVNAEAPASEGGKAPGEIKLSELMVGFHKLSELEERKLNKLESPKLSELTTPKLSELTSPKLSELSASKLSEIETRKLSELQSPTLEELTKKEFKELVVTLKKPLELTGNELKINETELGEKYVTRTTEQLGLTGKKEWTSTQRFQTPTAEQPFIAGINAPGALSGEGGTGSQGKIMEPFVPAPGGEETAAGSATGGKGGTFNLLGAVGGSAPFAKTKQTAGAGGIVQLLGGNGGLVTGEAGYKKIIGGAGGAAEHIGGEGTNTEAVCEETTGGAGGKAVLKGGIGGNAKEGSVSNTAGAGGEVLVEGGRAGISFAPGAVVANGGQVKIVGGSTAAATAKGGNLLLQAGPNTASEAESGVIQFQTGKSALKRIEITSIGTCIFSAAASVHLPIKVEETETFVANPKAIVGSSETSWCAFSALHFIKGTVESFGWIVEV